MKSESEEVTTEDSGNEDDWPKAFFGQGFSMRSLKRSRQVSGGVFTCRASRGPLSVLVQADVNRFRLMDERPHVIPEFAGCPDWTKALMFVEYQVISSLLFFSS